MLAPACKKELGPQFEMTRYNAPDQRFESVCMLRFSGIPVPRPKRLSHSACLLFLTAVYAATSPAPRELLLRLQQIVEQGDLDSAHNELESAIAAFSDEPVLYNLQGVVAAQQSDYAAAESNFKKALERAPNFVGALLNLGRLYQENAGKDPDALRKGLAVYEKILRYEPGNAEALYQSALLLELRGSFQASLERLKRLPGEARSRPQALAVICADYAGLGRSPAAFEATDELLRTPELRESDVLIALPVVEAHDETLAIKLLEGLDQRKLASGAQLARLGVLYGHAGQSTRARETLERAVRDGAPAVDTLSELARIAYQQQDRQGALGYLAHARDLDPSRAAVHYFFGMVCVEMNLPLEARKSLDEAVRLDPENAYYNYALGTVAMQGPNPGEAVPHFEKYIQRKPDDPQGRFALGAAYFHTGNYDAARKELGAVADRKETIAGAHYFLGRIAKQEEDLTTAESELQQAVARNPKFADALAELAHVHIRLQQYEKARRELERAAALDPESFRVNANLLILYQRTKDPRANAQQARFEDIKKKRSEYEQLLWRTIEIRPY